MREMGGTVNESGGDRFCFPYKYSARDFSRLDSHQMGKKWSILALGSDEQNPQRKPCIYGGVTVGKLKSKSIQFYLLYFCP